MQASLLSRSPVCCQSAETEITMRILFKITDLMLEYFVWNIPGSSLILHDQ